LALLVAVVLISQAAAQLGAKPPRRTSARGIVHLKEVEGRIFSLTNEARRKNGLATLDKDGTLTTVARAHSDDMLKRDYFSHENPDGLSPAQRVAPVYSTSAVRAGENIWGGSGHDTSDPKLLARVIVDGWMSSPGHRANILNPAYTGLGVGVSVLGKEIRATQVFVIRK
jgi:uncharacterized protein YkwD